MNSRIISVPFLAAFAAALCLGARAAPAVGRPAPDFTLTDIHGQTHSLSEYRGKTVVLEWVNPECPIVHKHYYSGNMPGLQQAAARAGIVWLSINSGGPGRQGDYDNVRAEAWLKRVGSHATDYFRDHDGKVGKLYDARTTPDMYIINPAGVLVYDGGIDSIRSADPEDIPRATNYVKEALSDLQAGRAVRTPYSKPYGCSVKYAD